MSNEVHSSGAPLLEAFKEHAGTAIWVGIFLSVAGVLALAAPFFAGISVTLMVGVMVILGGASQCVFAFRAGAVRTRSLGLSDGCPHAPHRVLHGEPAG